MKVDLKSLSNVELFYLKNEIFARNGFLFMDPTLRAHFKKFPWYQPIWDVPDFKIELTEKEHSFLDAIISEERNRRQSRISDNAGNQLLHFTDAANTNQFTKMPSALIDKLDKQNFAIVPSDDQQLYFTYEGSQYDYVPTFITTDVFLQLLHVHLSTLLSTIEEEKVSGMMNELLNGVSHESANLHKASSSADVKRLSDWTQTYAQIGVSLLHGNKSKLPPQMQKDLNDEFDKIYRTTNDTSYFLKTSKMYYLNFLPRGNYTRSEKMKCYFRAMKWLLTAPMYIDSSTSFSHAVLIARIINSSDKLYRSYKAINACLGTIAGKENNLSLDHLMTILRKDYANTDLNELLSQPKLIEIESKLLALDPKQYNKTADKPRVVFFAGRYTFDNEIHAKLVNKNDLTGLRLFPKGLDIFSILGNATAEQLLNDTSIEKRVWKAYPDSVAMLKQKFATTKVWDNGLFSKMMQALLMLQKKDKAAPPFMKTTAWDKKNLNTSLAAWAELRHDVILYLDQAAAEAGDGGDGPPPPKLQCYVEPNVAFWDKAAELIQYEDKALANLGLLTQKVAAFDSSLIDMARMLGNASRSELAGKFITESEMEKLSWLGGRISNLTTEMQVSGDAYGFDPDMAIIADVFWNDYGTLEAGVGRADYMYVLTEINGVPSLTRGSVFSYYEFESNGVYTDESWRGKLADPEKPQRQSWMQELILNIPPLEVSPEYSF
jgi:hypothetical protein